MIDEALELHLSSLQLSIRFQGASVTRRALRAVWQQTSETCYVPPQHAAEIFVREERGRVAVREGSQPERLAGCAEDATILVEDALYRGLMRSHWEAGLTVLHASAVVSGTRVLVFAGDSGSGKSALARAATVAGLRYFGDEHIVSDGAQLWGIPRAIHQDLHPRHAPHLPWHEGSDLESYQCRNREGEWFSLPLVRVPAETVQPNALPVENGVLVDLSRGDRDSIAPLRAAERLALVDRAHFVPGPGLTALAVAPKAFRLTWKDPQNALSLLLSVLDNA